MGAENSKFPYSLTGRYGNPTLECDLVMKGGITSGVVYPLAICKLAETYRFRSIGGASAGAIAAAATAAAEAARQAHPDSPRRGFAKLQDLPAELARRLPSGRSRLLSLFQPARNTRTAFDVILASIGPRPLPGKVIHVVTLVARRHPFVPVIALGMAIFVVWSAARLGRWQDIPVAAISVLLLLAGGVLGAVVLAARASALAIARNGGGICSGHAQSSRPDEPALAAWLDHLFNDIAGRPDGDPLTFGELRAQGIELAMMTTNLTHGRPTACRSRRSFSSSSGRARWPRCFRPGSWTGSWRRAGNRCHGLPAIATRPIASISGAGSLPRTAAMRVTSSRFRPQTTCRWSSPSGCRSRSRCS